MRLTARGTPAAGARCYFGLFTSFSLLFAVCGDPAQTEKLPGSLIPSEVAVQIRRLSSNDPADRGAGAFTLGKMGPAAAPAVPALVSLLRDRSPLVWRRLGSSGGPSTFPGQEAADALALIGAAAVESLIVVARSGDRPVSDLAGEALGKVRDPMAVEVLSQALKDTNSFVRHCAADALGGTGNRRAVESLIAALGDPDDYVRRAAAEALVKIGDPRALPVLTAHLGDAGAAVRRTSIEGLAKLGGREIVDFLVQALGDEDNTVRYVAAKELGKVHAARAVPALILALKDSDDLVVSFAAGSLSTLADPRAIRPLVAAYRSYPGVGDAVESAIGSFGPAAVELVITALRDASRDGPARGGLAVILGRIGDRRAVAPLIGFLGDPVPYVRFGAAEALGNLRDPSAVAPLIAALGDTYPQVRSDAAKSLGQIGDPRAVGPLINCLDTSDSFLPMYAMEALSKLTGQRFGNDAAAWRRWWKRE